MGCPTHNTGHGEYWCIDLLWQTYHLIDESAVEVEVGTSRFAASTMLLQTLDALLLYELQELILVLSSLLLCQFASQTLQLYGTRIAQCVHSMTDTIDETCLVVSLLVEHTGEINIQFLHILPVSDLLFQVMEHIDHLDVGTTMKRTFQAADTSGNRAVSICAGGRSDTHGKGRVVTTTMLCLDDEQQVEHSCIKLRIVLVLHHIKKVLCD